MDDVRVGRLLRALRLNRRLRQLDVAAAAGVSQSLISLIERGHVSKLSIETVRRIFGTRDARFEGFVSWRGGAIDRLLDERHAVLVGAFARALQAAGWHVDVEVTFNEFGDRGSIDILAHLAERRLVLVVEIKTELTSIEELIRRLDVKARLAPKIVSDRLGWKAGIVGRLVVVRDSATNRRRVARHDLSLGPALPDRGVAMRRWIRNPAGHLSGLQFYADTNAGGRRQPRRRPVAPAGAHQGAGSTRVAD